jgi:endonuclease/exonuclease/phosphatase (EEP) superfamily protein YafD
VFLHNLQELPQHIVGPWLLAGDFNLCRSAADKNNGRVDAHLCTSFNNTLDRLALVEIPLLDRFYTWSNKRDNPTLSNLDRVFANNAQCSAFPDTALTSLPRPTSDHTPLLLTLCTNIPKTTIFRFENAWLHNSSFLPMVLPAWSNAYPQVDTAGHLAACLKVTRTAAKVWNRRNRAPPALIQNCKFIILMFDTFEEYRCLSSAELQARALCRDRLSMAIKARAAYWKQRGKHLAIKEGDANTEFFSCARHSAHASESDQRH